MFLDHGAKVASVDVDSGSESASAAFLPIKCDVGSQDQVNSAVKQTTDKWGRLDILVNNAGILDEMSKINPVSTHPSTLTHTIAEGLVETHSDVWHRVLNVNLNGPMYLMRASIPRMMENENDPNFGRGSIVNVCSIAAIRGAVAGAAYTTSKHALLGLTRNTAWMYRLDGIRCNAVLPGAVRTAILTEDLQQTTGFDPDAMGPVLAPYMACAPGVCEPEHIAEAILNLVTAPSANGSELVIDKGWTAA